MSQTTNEVLQWLSVLLNHVKYLITTEIKRFFVSWLADSTSHTVHAFNVKPLTFISCEGKRSVLPTLSAFIQSINSYMIQL